MLQAGAPSESDLQDAAQSQRWLRLLQYDRHLFTGYRSRAGNKAFFFSPEGPREPLAELRATIAALTAQDPELRGHFQLKDPCAFPARARFLREVLHLELPQIACPDFKNWRQGLNAKGITLVFSAAYPNQPASMFGHTFLRIDSFADNTQFANPLLSYGVNFAASVPPDDGGILYGLRGIFGGYPGLYGIAPYYLTVNQYQSHENRDLWEYRLNFSPEDIDRLLEILWEHYATTHFDYYFLDENCSYQIISLLETARPDWDLTSKVGHLVFPKATLLAVLDQQQALVDVSYRPSGTTLLRAAIDRLDAQQNRDMWGLINEEVLEFGLADAPTLDAFIAYLNYQKSKVKDEAAMRPLQAKLDRALSARAAMKVQTSAPTIAEPESRPDLGHREHAAYARIEGGRDIDPSMGLGIRWGYHDWLNLGSGFADGSDIHFFDGTLLYNQAKRRVAVGDITLVHVASLSPFWRFDPRMSWRTGAAVLRPQLNHSTWSHELIAFGGGGMTFNAADHLWFYSMADLTAGHGIGVSARPFVRPDVAIGLVTPSLKPVRFTAETRLMRQFLPAGRANSGLQTDLAAAYSPSVQSEIRLTTTHALQLSEKTSDTWLFALQGGMFFN